ncbi:MAG: signal peptidase I [Nanoarchaeota archaeon]|nr:signal peptidase I [Nanoarchaeota archaeon]
MKKKKSSLRKVWKFIWEDDSIWSWLLNIAIAFLLIKFLIYPGIGLILGTPFPIVAVVSESMEHGLHNGQLCGAHLDEFKYSFDNYWKTCGPWYEQHGITADQFSTFPIKNGFNKGDVIILMSAKNVKLGDVLVYKSSKPQPIIHRTVRIYEEDGQTFYQTKGDHNRASITSAPLNEARVTEDIIVGKGVVRIPYLGWIKILFVEAVRPLGINIQR